MNSQPAYYDWKGPAKFNTKKTAIQVISGLGNPHKLCLPALFIGPFEHVERFQNLKFAVKRITNVQSTVLSSSEGTAAVHLAFK